MATKKLEGFKLVAVVQFARAPHTEYYYALYDEDIEPGDEILVSGVISEWPIVKRVITAQEAALEFKNNIIAEVICKIDTSRYAQRINKRKQKEKLKSEMDKRKKEIQKMKDDEYYANIDAVFAGMLKEYTSYEV